MATTALAAACWQGSIRTVVQNPTRRAAGRSRKLDILASASAVFRGRGFHRASMEEIADRLGMTKGNLYYYFPGKQDLLFFCQKEALRRLAANAEQILAGRGTSAEKLERLITSHLVCVLEEMGGSLAHAEFEELAPLQRRHVVGLRDRYEAFFRRVIGDGQDSGEFAPGDGVKLVQDAERPGFAWCRLGRTHRS